MHAPTILATALAVLSLGVAPQAIAKPPVVDSGQCFSGDRVINFAASRDEKTVNLRIRGGGVYQFELFGRCPQIDNSQQIAINSGGSRRICSGRDATIITISSFGPQRCLVRNMRKLTEAEIAALPGRARP